MMKLSTPEVITVSEGVTARLQSEIDDGRYLDTGVVLQGNFVIAGQDREAFLREINALIEKYRI